MCCRIYKVIDENGLQVESENFKENDLVSIYNAKRNKMLKLKTKSGVTIDLGQVQNTLFQDVFLVKTNKFTLVLEPL